MRNAERKLTLDADDVVTYLLRDLLIGYELDEIVNGINRRVDALEALDLLPNRQRIVEELRAAP